MILRLLLELLALIGGSAEAVQGVVDEVHSDDTTGTKVAKIATMTGHIAAAASQTLDAASTKTEP